MPISTENKDLVFLSYASKDRTVVSTYYDEIKQQGFNLWMDVHELKAGQNWDFEISRALEKAAIIIIFISENSVDKRGYVQKELAVALDKYKEKLVDDIYIIPVMLDDITIPDLVKSVQAVFEKDGNVVQKIVDAMSEQFSRLGKSVANLQESHNLKWGFVQHKDSWDGLPGYDASYAFIRVTSPDNPGLEEIGHIIRGELASQAMSQKTVMFEQNANVMNFGQKKYWRTNIYDAQCTSVTIVENLLSVEYAISTFVAGAAHGHTGYATYVFIINPTLYLEKLEFITRVENNNKALEAVQASARKQLLALEFGFAGDVNKLEEGWVNEGTASWEHFSNFTFSRDGIVVIFPPYQVAPFAFGSQRVTLKWRTVRPFVQHYILSAAGREFEHQDEKTEGEQVEDNNKARSASSTEFSAAPIAFGVKRLGKFAHSHLTSLPVSREEVSDPPIVYVASFSRRGLVAKTARNRRFELDRSMKRFVAKTDVNGDVHAAPAE